jgi:hypothetical protein
MYLCPHCHEEIPDRIRQSRDDCPFCHEPWPPGETVQTAGEQEPAPAGQEELAGQPGQQGGAESAVDTPIIEPEPKSKLGLIIGIIAAVLVIGGGGAAYFLLGGEEAGDGKKVVIKVGDQKVELKKLYDVEYEEMVKWHNEVRKTILKFFANRCDTYRQNGFNFASRLVTREKLVSATQKVKQLEVEIQTVKGKEKPLDHFNWFKCPGIFAYVHKEHELGVKMGFSIKEQTLGPDIRRAFIEITGGRFVSGKGKYRSSWDQGRSGLRFPGLAKEAKDQPGVLALSGHKPRRKGEKGTFELAGLKFKKVDTGRHRSKSFLVGKWEAHASTDTFKDLLKSWEGGCRGLKRKVREINKDYEPDRFKLPPLKDEAVKVAIDVCKGISTIASAVEPWDKDAIKKARLQLHKALERAQKNLRQPLMDAAKILKTDIKPASWCGDPKTKGSPCSPEEGKEKKSPKKEG